MIAYRILSAIVGFFVGCVAGPFYYAACFWHFDDDDFNCRIHHCPHHD